MPSAKVLEKKKAQVEVVSEKLKSSKLTMFIDYKGITVEEDRDLRKALREAGYESMVVKNSILKLAAEKAGIKGLDEILQGPTTVVFGEEYTVGPKIANDFAKTREVYTFKGGVMDGEKVDGAKLMKLAKLPSREMLLAGLATALLGNIRNLAVVLDQVSKREEVEANA